MLLYVTVNIVYNYAVVCYS